MLLTTFSIATHTDLAIFIIGLHVRLETVVKSRKNSALILFTHEMPRKRHSLNNQPDPSKRKLDSGKKPKFKKPTEPNALDQGDGSNRIFVNDQDTERDIETHTEIVDPDASNRPEQKQIWDIELEEIELERDQHSDNRPDPQHQQEQAMETDCVELAAKSEELHPVPQIEDRLDELSKVIQQESPEHKQDIEPISSDSGVKQGVCDDLGTVRDIETHTEIVDLDVADKPAHKQVLDIELQKSELERNQHPAHTLDEDTRQEQALEPGVEFAPRTKEPASDRAKPDPDKFRKNDPFNKLPKEIQHESPEHQKTNGPVVQYRTVDLGDRDDNSTDKDFTDTASNVDKEIERQNTPLVQAARAEDKNLEAGKSQTQAHEPELSQPITNPQIEREESTSQKSKIELEPEKQHENEKKDLGDERGIDATELAPLELAAITQEKQTEHDRGFRTQELPERHIEPEIDQEKKHQLDKETLEQIEIAELEPKAEIEPLSQRETSADLQNEIQLDNEHPDQGQIDHEADREVVEPNQAKESRLELGKQKVEQNEKEKHDRESSQDFGAVTLEPNTDFDSERVKTELPETQFSVGKAEISDGPFVSYDKANNPLSQDVNTQQEKSHSQQIIHSETRERDQTIAESISPLSEPIEVAPEEKPERIPQVVEPAQQLPEFAKSEHAEDENLSPHHAAHDLESSKQQKTAPSGEAKPDTSFLSISAIDQLSAEANASNQVTVNQLEPHDDKTSLAAPIEIDSSAVGAIKTLPTEIAQTQPAQPVELLPVELNKEQQIEKEVQSPAVPHDVIVDRTSAQHEPRLEPEQEKTSGATPSDLSFTKETAADRDDRANLSQTNAQTDSLLNKVELSESGAASDPHSRGTSDLAEASLEQPEARQDSPAFEELEVNQLEHLKDSMELAIQIYMYPVVVERMGDGWLELIKETRELTIVTPGTRGDSNYLGTPDLVEIFGERTRSLELDYKSWGVIRDYGALEYSVGEDLAKFQNNDPQIKSLQDQLGRAMAIREQMLRDALEQTRDFHFYYYRKETQTYQR